MTRRVLRRSKMRLRRPPRKRKVRCDCGMIFRSRKVMKAHLDSCPVEHSRLMKLDAIPIRRVTCTRKETERHKHQYKCCFCDVRCKRAVHIEEHLKLRHGKAVLRINTRLRDIHYKKEKKFKCEVGCDRVFNSRFNVRKHITLEHPDHKLQCGLCDYTAAISMDLSKHRRTEHNLKEESMICDTCGAVYKSRSQLMIHNWEKHKIKDPELKIYECPECDYKTSRKQSMYKHALKHKPLAEVGITCEHCGKQFRDERNLKKHVNCHHLNIPGLTCDLCGKNCNSPEALKAHRTWHEERKYHCPQCPYQAHQKPNLRDHMYSSHRIVVDKERYPVLYCGQCNYSTVNKARYGEHCETHTMVRQHVCQYCGDSFRTKPTLYNHITWKHRNVSYPCQFCTYSCPNLFLLREHTRIQHTHKDRKPYKCGHCDFRAHTSGNCRKHCQANHRGLEIKWVKLMDKYDETSPCQVTIKSHRRVNNTAIPERHKLGMSGNDPRTAHLPLPQQPPAKMKPPEEAPAPGPETTGAAATTTAAAAVVNPAGLTELTPVPRRGSGGDAGAGGAGAPQQQQNRAAPPRHRQNPHHTAAAALPQPNYIPPPVSAAEEAYNPHNPQHPQPPPPPPPQFDLPIAYRNFLQYF